MDSWRRLISVLALTSVAGCSLALSGPDANRPKSRAPECDTGKGPVALDGVVGSVLATAALVALSDNQQSVAVVTGLVAAAYLGAAFHGNSNVEECRSALAAYNTRSHEPAPEQPEVATAGMRPPSRPVVAEPGPAPLPPEYVQPQSPPTATPPRVAPPVVVAPPSIKTAPPSKAPKTAGPRPAPSADGPVDWHDFWTEVP